MIGWLRSHLPLSNRLRWRVVAGLTAVAVLAVAGVAVVAGVLAAEGERAVARDAVATEADVLAGVVAARARDGVPVDEVLAPVTGVVGWVVDGGTVVARTTGATADAPPDVPPDGGVVEVGLDGEDVLVTARPVADGRVLVLAFDQLDTRASLRSLRSSLAVAAVVVAAGLALLMALLARRILEPVDRTALAARRLAQGALGTRLGDDSPHPFADLTGAFDEMAAALEETVEGLTRMEARQRRFVADVSHELRTPLQALSTASDLLEPAIGELDGPPRRAAEALVDEVRRLRELVADLMEISRIDAGGAEVRDEEVDLAVAVARVLARRGWRDRVDVDVPAGLLVATDPRRLDTVLANLVGNALAHGAPPVQVRGRADGEVVVEVVDHGEGIPPADADRVFERFAKADRARTRAAGGSGLGLAIARENAGLLGGTLGFTCPPTGGTTFTLRLPIGR